MSQQTQTSEDESTAPEFLVAAFYKFVPMPDYKAFRETLLERCESLELLGSILLAEEGINGTISGLPDRVRDQLLAGDRQPTMMLETA